MSGCSRHRLRQTLVQICSSCGVMIYSKSKGGAPTPTFPTPLVHKSKFYFPFPRRCMYRSVAWLSQTFIRAHSKCDWNV